MRREEKFIGALLLTLGLTAVLTGTSILFGVSAQSDGVSCKSICGLSLLVTTFLGASAGALASGLLWLVAGVVGTVVGYRVIRDPRNA